MGHLSRSLAALCVALSALPALAGTIHVTSGSDDLTTPPAGGIREAIANAQPGDTIVIDPNVTVRLAGDLVVPAGKDLTIEGPAPNGLKIPGKVTQDTPAPVPPAKFIVQGTGTTVRQLTFDGVTLVIDHASATVATCAFDMHLTGPGVVLKGATGGTIGTPDEVNTFTNCTQGVESQGSTDVTITNNHFSKNDTAVLSIDDKNVTVTGNSMKDGDGVALLGSSGTISSNKIKPDSQVGVGIKAGKSPDSLPSSGKVTVTGNDVKVSGQAKGVVNERGTDVTISSNDVHGKTKGPGLLVSCDASTEGGGICEVTGNDVTGCTPGVELACADAPQMTCTLEGNAYANCPGGGLVAHCGPNVTFECTGDTADRCGGRDAPFAVELECSGPSATCGQLTVLNAKGDACRVGPGTTWVALVDLVVDGAKGDGVGLISGFTLLEGGVDFNDVGGADVFVGDGSGLSAQEDFLRSELFDASRSRPLLDAAPRSWGSTPVIAAFDGDGNLVVTVTSQGPGTYVLLTNHKDPVGGRKYVGMDGTVTFTPAELPAGAVVDLAVGRDPDGTGGPGMHHYVGDAHVKRPEAPAGGTTHTFTVSQTKVTITTKVGADGSVSVDVTNHSDQPQVLEVGKLTGNFFNFPSGMVTFQGSETKAIEIGHSAMKVVNETAKLIFKFGGEVEAAVTVTGITK